MEAPVEQIIDELVRDALATDGFVSAEKIASQAQEKYPGVITHQVVDLVISKVGQSCNSTSW